MQRDALAREILHPDRFTIAPGVTLTFDATPDLELHWEIFQGRLLDATGTRERRRFDAWDLRVDGAGPLISLLFDREANYWHVTRGLFTHAYETYDKGGAILTREAKRWVRELIGGTGDAVQLPRLVFLAVVGTSRLPLTSLETPLPQFSLGQIGYFPDGVARAAVKNLEWRLRCEALPLPDATGGLSRLREVFLDVSLSPYTGFVDRALAFARQCSAAEQADFFAWLLRLQWRHLNAYDLHVFHHRGANYPDALLIDAALRELIRLAASQPDLFADAGRRRGLRLGWLLRVLYAGHRVPEQPTSPGENLRVLPEPFRRVPDEQIRDSRRRPRTLFDAPLALSAMVERLVVESLRDLSDPRELRELGAALLLDRPLGVRREPGEPDDSPMLAYLARSKQLIARHLRALAAKGDGLVTAGLPDGLLAMLDQLHLPGVPLMPLGRPPRPGVVSLDDAFQTADDFVAERTLRRSLEEIAARIPVPPETHLLLPMLGADGELLRAFDANYTAVRDVSG